MRPIGLTLGMATKAESNRVSHPRGSSAAEAGSHLTRSRYSPVRVSIRIFSPGLTNGGTWTFRPVSSVASLYWLVAVAPARAGGVSVTVSSTKSGTSIETGLSLMYLTITSRVGQQVVHRRADDLGREAELVVCLGVHEHVIVAGRVEVFVLLGLDVRDFDLVDGTEPFLDQGAVVHVPQLGLDHRPEVARRVVGEVEDDEVDAFHRDHHSSTDVGRFEHHGGSQFSCGCSFAGGESAGTLRVLDKM